MKIKDCIEAIGISTESVTSTTDWSVIKAAYRQKILVVHPDKPDGSDAEFRAVRSAYEALRSLYDKSPDRVFERPGRRRRLQVRRRGRSRSVLSRVAGRRGGCADQQS
eukprot:426125-Prymnesium_polylepis.1